MLNSVLSSGVGGILGQYLSNPFYLLKAEHHAESENKGSYTDTAKRIFREHGVSSWRNFLYS